MWRAPCLPLPCLHSTVYPRPWGSQALPGESQLAAELCPSGSSFLPGLGFSLWLRKPDGVCLSVCTTDDLDVRYTAVSSFIFLRFFAPAILSPNLFQLTPHHTVSEPQTQLRRTSQPDPASPPAQSSLLRPRPAPPDPSGPADQRRLGKVLLAE